MKTFIAALVASALTLIFVDTQAAIYSDSANNAFYLTGQGISRWDDTEIKPTWHVLRESQVHRPELIK